MCHAVEAVEESMFNVVAATYATGGRNEYSETTGAADTLEQRELDPIDVDLVGAS